ncbi:MAG: Holliday junction resolvase RuvX [Proteobacteria bacterium]|nr:Holliday junction resolvase RuvX [Pseudomonadota bacterium]
MGICIGLDIGTARTGIAESDPSSTFAFPMRCVRTDDLLDDLRSHYQNEAIDGLVIGLPKRLNGEPTHGTGIAQSVAVTIQKALPSWTIHWEDERFTSKIAAHAAAISGNRKAVKKDKGKLDASAAAIILDSYLTHKS